MALTKVQGEGISGVSISANNEITMSSQPAFHAGGLSSSMANLSTGTDHTVVFNTEIFDQNGDYNTSTGEFTAPVTGKYQFSFMVYVNDIDTGATFYQAKLKTSNKTYIFIVDPNFDGDATYYTFHAPALLVDMDASDTAKIQIAQAGGNPQTDVSDNDSYTVFSGYLVC